MKFAVFEDITIIHTSSKDLSYTLSIPFPMYRQI